MTVSKATGAVLEFIRQRIDKRGYPPTLRELADGLGIGSTNGVRYHLDVLERAGYIERDRGTPRGIRVMQNGRPRTAKRKPRVLGAERGR